MAEEKRVKAFLKMLFRRYYSKMYRPDEHLPQDFRKREFAFQPFDKEDVMIRHIKFESLEDLKRYLIENVPKHFYYSTAIYEYPDATPMEAKGWLGAELVFDIDVDKIETPCKVEHDTWRCLECGYSGRGMEPEACPNCGSKRIKGDKWVCAKCLEVARNEVLKLIDVLENDFGISRSKLRIYFSGHRGFHIHVLDEDGELYRMDADTRREICDYIRLVGFDVNRFISFDGESLKIHFSVKTPGMLGRIARRALEIAAECGDSKFAEALKKALQYGKPLRKRYHEMALDVLTRAAADVKCNIDERVTMDVHRLIRAPGSLHGKTGLAVVETPASFLENDFEPERLIELASPFAGMTLRIRVFDAPKTVLVYDLNVGKDEVVELPMPAAIYLLSKGRGCLP